MRTNNQIESDPKSGKITPCVMRYFHNQIAETIPHRIKPGVTLCAYTEYESDVMGDYTYFIGEEVSSVAKLPDGLEALVVPEQRYAKFTVGPGPMPGVVIGAWQTIWEMTPEELGGTRCYATDFELYDERAADHHNVVLDLYIGIA